METITITSRIRNLGYAWTTQPEQRYNSRGNGYLTIPAPTRPQVSGGLRTVEAEREHCGRIVGSDTDCTESLFVGFRRIHTNPGHTVGTILFRLREYGSDTVELDEPA